MQVKNLSLALLLSAAALLSAQSSKHEVQLSNEYAVPKRHINVGLWGTEKEGLVNLSLKLRKEVMVYPVNTKENTVGEPEITDLSWMDRGYLNERFLTLKNNNYWFYSHWDEDNGKAELFVRPFDRRNYKFSANDKKVLDTKPSYRYLNGVFGFRVSSDSSKLLVTYDVSLGTKSDKNEKRKLGLRVMDHNLNTIWEHEVKMPHSLVDMDGLDITMDNDGNVFILAKVYDDLTREKKKDEAPKYHFEVFKMSGNKAEPDIVQVTLDNKFVRNTPILAIDAQGQIVCVGYYGDKAATYMINGVFMFRLDSKTGAVANNGIHYYPISMDVLKLYVSKRQQAKMDKREAKGKDMGEGNLYLRSVSFNEDGSITVSGEEFFISVSTMTDKNGHTTTTYTYYYTDIIALRVGADGTLHWITKIPKVQVGQRSLGTMSFFHTHLAGKDYYLYMDNEANLDLDTDEAPSSYYDKKQKGILMCVTIDKNGKIDRESLINPKKTQFSIEPTSIYKIGESRIAGYVKVSRKKGRILTVTLK